MEYDPVMRIEIYSHFFKILNPNPNVTRVILMFSRRFSVCKDVGVKTNNRYAKEETKSQFTVFAYRSSDNSEFRFHVGQYEEFIQYLEFNHIAAHLYTVTKVGLYEPVKIDVELNPSYELRDYQKEIVEFVSEEVADDNRSRLIALGTGLGKTLSSLAAIGTIKTRTLIVILPTYIDQWAKEITKILNVKPKEIMVVKGSAQMEGLIGLGQDGALKAKFIIVSLPTFRNFLKNFEYNVNDYKPEDICKILGIGTIIIDETHQHLHGVYSVMMSIHVPRVIGLSATLMSDDPIVKKVQHCMFPKEIRFDKVKLDQYIKVYAIAYRFINFYKANLRTTERGSNNYSHNAFEKSIMHNKEVLDKYLNFIAELIEKAYNKDYVKGDKLLIFASSIAMCTTITNYVKKEFPDFTVARFVEDDPYENMLNPDIRVSTILSCGTGKDIPNLRATIMTTSVSSSVSNIQAIGRLRKLPDRDVKFYYIFCEQIPKHCQYHSSKKQLFHDRVASIKELKYPYGL